MRQGVFPRAGSMPASGLCAPCQRLARRRDRRRRVLTEDPFSGGRSIPVGGGLIEVAAFTRPRRSPHRATASRADPSASLGYQYDLESARSGRRAGARTRPVRRGRQVTTMALTGRSHGGILNAALGPESRSRMWRCQRSCHPRTRCVRCFDKKKGRPLGRVLCAIGPGTATPSRHRRGLGYLFGYLAEKSSRRVRGLRNQPV